MTEAAELTRELGLLAGEGFARVRLEPDGYHRIAVDFIPFAGFDFVYERDGDVVLNDTLAADQQLDALHTPSGPIEAGSRAYVEIVIANMRRRAPQVSELIATALAAEKLRYYEVRQPFDEEGNLLDITVRQFAL